MIKVYRCKGIPLIKLIGWLHNCISKMLPSFLKLYLDYIFVLIIVRMPFKLWILCDSCLDYSDLIFEIEEYYLCTNCVYDKTDLNKSARR